MAITVADCFDLPSLRIGSLVAGERGLSHVVESVSVLEWIDTHSLQDQFFLQNEIVITSFYTLRQSVDEQLLAVRKLHNSGEVAMVLYYAGVVLPDIDARLLQLCDELNFPLLLMPPHELQYRCSDAIMEIAECVLREQKHSSSLVDAMMEKLALVPLQFRSAATILRALSDRSKCGFILSGVSKKSVTTAAWPINAPISVPDLLDAYAHGKGAFGGYFIADEIALSTFRQKNARLLLMLPESSIPPPGILAQAAHVLQLTLKLWNVDEFEDESKNDSFAFMAAILNNEPLRLRDLETLPKRCLASRAFRSALSPAPMPGVMLP